MTNKPKKLQSTYALLDVMHGREKLLRYTGSGKKLKVCIHGEIDYEYGRDDGVSREFVVDVTKVTIK